MKTHPDYWDRDHPLRAQEHRFIRGLPLDPRVLNEKPESEDYRGARLSDIFLELQKGDPPRHTRSPSKSAPAQTQHLPMAGTHKTRHINRPAITEHQNMEIPSSTRYKTAVWRAKKYLPISSTTSAHQDAKTCGELERKLAKHPHFFVMALDEEGTRTPIVTRKIFPVYRVRVRSARVGTSFGHLNKSTRTPDRWEP